jgi:hypothetical protein
LPNTYGLPARVASTGAGTNVMKNTDTARNETKRLESTQPLQAEKFIV